MHVKLKVLRGASAGKEVVVNGPRFFIGRSEECHLRANSDAISRRHCAITVENDTVKIRDLGSRNGTFVNGVRIDGDHRIEMGDQLRVGPLEFLVTYLVQARAKTASASTGSRGSEDMDGLIGDWLSEADEHEKERPGISGETREFRLDETNRIDAQLIRRSDADAAKADASTANPKRGTSEAESHKTESQETGIQGGSDPSVSEAANGVEESAISEGENAAERTSGPAPRRSSQKTPPKDTQEAAEQTLRKFFNRGG